MALFTNVHDIVNRVINWNKHFDGSHNMVRLFVISSKKEFTLRIYYFCGKYHRFLQIPTCLKKQTVVQLLIFQAGTLSMAFHGFVKANPHINEDCHAQNEKTTQEGYHSEWLEYMNIFSLRNSRICQSLSLPCEGNYQQVGA